VIATGAEIMDRIFLVVGCRADDLGPELGHDLAASESVVC